MQDDSFTGLDRAKRGRLPRSRGSHSLRGAIYHLSVRTGSRSKGHSARAAAAYIQREQEYERGRSLAGELVYAESGHMPRWAEAAPATYWRAADAHERANGRLFKRLEFALPLALDADQRRALAVGFAHHLTDDEHLPYTLAIHAGKGTNPHAHLLISERGNDGLERAPARWFKRYNAAAPELGGARKSEALKPKAWLEETREAWAALTNQALERAGHAVRVDHRSLAEQGIDRAPGLHLGPAVMALEARGIATDRGTEDRARARENAELERQLAEIAQRRAAIEREIEREGMVAEMAAEQARLSTPAAPSIQQEETDYERTRPGPKRGGAELTSGRGGAAEGAGRASPSLGGPGGGPLTALGRGEDEQHGTEREQSSVDGGAKKGRGKNARADMALGEQNAEGVAGVEAEGVGVGGAGVSVGGGGGAGVGGGAGEMADVIDQDEKAAAQARWKARLEEARARRLQEEAEQRQVQAAERAAALEIKQLQEKALAEERKQQRARGRDRGEDFEREP